MKNLFIVSTMKTIQLFTLAVLSVLVFTSFKPVSATYDDSYYAFIVVDGVYKNKVGYVSRIIYYPGYDGCNRNKNTDYFREARSAFSEHLRANYTGAFPYGENNDFRMIELKKNSTTELLKTRAQAEQRMTEWIAEQKEKGYKVQTTNFSYSCSN